LQTPLSIAVFLWLDPGIFVEFFYISFPPAAVSRLFLVVDGMLSTSTLVA